MHDEAKTLINAVLKAHNDHDAARLQNKVSDCSSESNSSEGAGSKSRNIGNPKPDSLGEIEDGETRIRENP